MSLISWYAFLVIEWQIFNNFQSTASSYLQYSSMLESLLTWKFCFISSFWHNFTSEVSFISVQYSVFNVTLKHDQHTSASCQRQTYWWNECTFLECGFHCSALLHAWHTSLYLHIQKPIENAYTHFFVNYDYQMSSAKNVSWMRHTCVYTITEAVLCISRMFWYNSHRLNYNLFRVHFPIILMSQSKIVLSTPYVWWLMIHYHFMILINVW